MIKQDLEKSLSESLEERNLFAAMQTRVAGSGMMWSRLLPRRCLHVNPWAVGAGDSRYADIMTSFATLRHQQDFRW
jgi:hypothetical protein